MHSYSAILLQGSDRLDNRIQCNFSPPSSDGSDSEGYAKSPSSSMEGISAEGGDASGSSGFSAGGAAMALGGPGDIRPALGLLSPLMLVPQML